MAEEIINFKKIFVKYGIEEEPVIVIQRFLNLFKQSHIFDETQKNRFHKMILDFPSELRGMFKILPGGGLLQDYVDDLEVATGNVRDKSVNVSGSLTQDESAPSGPAAAGNMALGGKIVADESFARELAKAFSGTNAGPISGKVVVDESFAKELAKAFSAAPVGSGGGKVVADESFAKELAKALSENQTASTGGKVVADESFAKEITGAIVQVIKHNNENKKEDERFFLEESIKKQSELFSQMAKTQSKELANAMVAALREAQELSIKSFIEAIKTIHIQPNAASNSNYAPVPQAPLNVVNGGEVVVNGGVEVVNEEDEWEYVEADANEAEPSASDSNSAPQAPLNVVNGEEIANEEDEWDYIEVDANEADLSGHSLPNHKEKQSANPMTAPESPPGKTPVMVSVPSAAHPETEVKTLEISEAGDDFDFDFLEQPKASHDVLDTLQRQPEPSEKTAQTAPEAPKAPQVSPPLPPAPQLPTEDEWEWQEISDPVPDSGNSLDEKEGQDEDEESSGNEDDWEWEYEEVEDKGQSLPAKATNTLSGTPDDEEWEWEYEEVPAEGKDEEGDIMEEEEERFIPSNPVNIPSKSSL